MQTGARTAMVAPHGVYFGWRVVLALFLCTFTLFGVSIYSFVTMTASLSKTYGWSPADTGSLVSAMWLVAPLSLFLGPVINRFGPWRLLFFGFLLQAVVMMALPLVSEIWQAYGLRLVMGLGKISMVVAIPVIIGRWFSGRFATAMAIVWAGGSAGGMVLSPATEHLLTLYGWQTASWMMAGGVAISIVLVFLLVRGANSPTDLGAGIDGRPVSDVVGAAKREPLEPDDNRQDVRRILASLNWVTAATMMAAVIGSGLAAIAIISQEPTIMADAGISPADAATVLGLFAAAAAIGSACVGWLLDRASAVVSSVTVWGSMFAGLAAFYLLPQNPSVFIAGFAAIMIGYAVGGGEVLWMTLTRRQFGETAYPTTYGAWYLCLQIGYAFGGGLAGLTFLNFGTVGFLVFVGVMYVPAAIFSMWRPGIRQ